MCVNKAYGLRSLDEVLAKIDADCQTSIAYARNSAAEQKAKAIEGRQLAALLHAAGLLDATKELTAWDRLTYVKVDMGLMPQARHTKARREWAERFRTLKRLVGSLQAAGSHVSSDEDALKGITTWNLEAPQWPTLRVSYRRKVKKGKDVKCRIVKQHHVSYSLVCEGR